MMQNDLNRSWCGRAQYPNCEPFTFGTIVLDKEARDHEVRAALDALWAEIIPFAPPSYVPVPGALFFKEEAG